MELTHRFRVPASVEETWTAFNHLDRLAPCFPGATISHTDGDRFEGSVKIKIGPLALVFDGSGRFVQRNTSARRLVLQATGADRRGNGTATATVTASMSGNGTATEVELVTDLDFTGRPAQFGQPVVADVSHKLLDQFVSCVSSRFAEGLGLPGPEDGAPAPAAEPDTTDELWEEWAEGEEPAADPGPGPSDVEQTMEMTAVGAVPDDPTPLTDEAWLAEEDDAAAVDQAPGPEPARRPTPPPRPYRYTPPSNVAQSHANVVGNVVSTLLVRYGPLLGFLSLLVVIVVKLVNRWRRR